MTKAPKGVFLAGMGLPGTGKSSTIEALGMLIGATVLLEPEEAEWGQAVRERKNCGFFSGLMWFRSTRVPLIYQADRLRRSAQIVLLDSYYDKVLSFYLGKPGMEWLLDPTDPYFACAEAIARLDLQHLPDADCVILFEINETDWRKMVAARGRDLDKDEDFLNSFGTQEYFVAAAEEVARERGIRLIRFKQVFGSATHSAALLHAQLQNEGILP